MSLRQAAEQIIAWYAEGQRPTGDDIVDTLREALAQPERRCEAGVSLQGLWDCWDAVHSGKQEPTAWMDAVGDLTFRTPSVKLRPYWTPLYLHPTPVPEGWLEEAKVDPYAELKAAAKDPTKQIRCGKNGTWADAGTAWAWERPVKEYEVRNKPQKMKLLAYIDGVRGELLWRLEGYKLSSYWKRFPAADIEGEVEE